MRRKALTFAAVAAASVVLPASALAAKGKITSVNNSTGGTVFCADVNLPGVNTVQQYTLRLPSGGTFTVTFTPGATCSSSTGGTTGGATG